MMPLLPLTNATQKDLTILSQLMYTSYVKMDGGFPDTQSAETMLRAIMSGVNGQYLQDASFASGASPNLVSACLLTLDTPDEAKIQQLFTHPLYRARGLATTEIAAAMNRLSGSGIRSLTAWSREDNGVVTRLLTKLGFGQERTAVEMLAST
jgi:predicted GNAT family acetyltransferase